MTDRSGQNPQPIPPLSQQTEVTGPDPFTNANQAGGNPTVRPMNQAHTPITMDEMNPNMKNKKPKSGMNMLLTLLSLLILAGVVGITLWFYIQNKTTKLTSNAPESQQNDTTQPQTNAQTEAIPTMTQEQQKEVYGNVICRRFTSIEEALQVPEIACVLDLSGQGISSLPENITRLTKLNELNLSDNKFSEFPTVLYQFTSLFSINLENNQLSTFPEDIKSKIPSLQSIKLKGNNLSEEVIEKYLELNVSISPVQSQNPPTSPVNPTQ